MSNDTVDPAKSPTLNYAPSRRQRRRVVLGVTTGAIVGASLFIFVPLAFLVLIGVPLQDWHVAARMYLYKPGDAFLNVAFYAAWCGVAAIGALAGVVLAKAR